MRKRILVIAAVLSCALMACSGNNAESDSIAPEAAEATSEVTEAVTLSAAPTGIAEESRESEPEISKAEKKKALKKAANKLMKGKYSDYYFIESKLDADAYEDSDAYEDTYGEVVYAVEEKRYSCTLAYFAVVSMEYRNGEWVAEGKPEEECELGTKSDWEDTNDSFIREYNYDPFYRKWNASGEWAFQDEYRDLHVHIISMDEQLGTMQLEYSLYERAEMTPCQLDVWGEQSYQVSSDGVVELSYTDKGAYLEVSINREEGSWDREYFLPFFFDSITLYPGCLLSEEDTQPGRMGYSKYTLTSDAPSVQEEVDIAKLAREFIEENGGIERDYDDAGQDAAETPAGDGEQEQQTLENVKVTYEGDHKQYWITLTDEERAILQEADEQYAQFLAAGMDINDTSLQDYYMEYVDKIELYIDNIIDCEIPSSAVIPGEDQTTGAPCQWLDYYLDGEPRLVHPLLLPMDSWEGILDREGNLIRVFTNSGGDSYSHHYLYQDMYILKRGGYSSGELWGPDRYPHLQEDENYQSNFEDYIEPILDAVNAKKQ